MVEKKCALGVAFDGDGDRAIFVDQAGDIVNGDAVLLMCARQLQREGRLKGNAIVATVMSNIGLQIALAETGIGIVRCPVGDKYVMEEMLARGLSLGGEQSGHIIFSDYLFTGDGLCTALNVLRTVAHVGPDAGRAGEGSRDLPADPDQRARARESRPGDRAGDCRRDRARRAAPRRPGAPRSSATRAPSRSCASCSRAATEHEVRAWAQEIADVVKRELG